MKGTKPIPIREWIRRDWLAGVAAPKVAQVPALVVIGLFVVLSSLGITNSSMGIGFLTEDAGTDGGVVLGTPRFIRSDEFFRATPWRLGTLQRPVDDYQSPLVMDPFYSISAIPNDGVAEYLVFLDATAVELFGPILPDSLVFSLYWWLPTIVVLLALPVWLQMLGVRRRISWLAALLVVLSPAVAWWSAWPLNPLAWSLLASLLLMWAVDRACARERVSVWAVAMASASGVLLARTAFSYFPWAFPVAIAVLLPTLPLVVARDHTRRRMLMLGIAAGVGLLAVALVLIENWGSFVALTNTVYPGTRRVTGSAVNPGIVFGAQHLGILRQDPITVATNQSELSTAYTILIVPTAVLLAALPRNAWRFSRTQATAGLLIAVLALFFVWIMVDVPSFIGEAIPGMNRVQPPRLAQIIGIPVVFLFAIVLDRFDRFPSSRIPRKVTVLVASSLTFLMSAWSGVLLKSSHIPDLRLRSILLVSIVLGVLVALVIARPGHLSSLAALAAGALAVIIFVNPIMAGFGELVDGQAAEFVRAHSGDADDSMRWTSDNYPAGAVLMANGIPALSGQQWVGPSEEDWSILDPDRSSVEVWNRGTSSIFVVPTTGLGVPDIESPYPDVIVVRIDPCDPALDAFRVTHMITSEPVESPCLSGIGGFDLGGAARFVYRRSLSGG